MRTNLILAGYMGGKLDGVMLDDSMKPKTHQARRQYFMDCMRANKVLPLMPLTERLRQYKRVDVFCIHCGEHSQIRGNHLNIDEDTGNVDYYCRHCNNNTPV